MYHLKLTFATAARILRQLSHDHRTLALVFIVPCLLLALLHWLFEDSEQTFAAIAPALLGVFPFVLMFIITSITTLRERVGGTMERLMASPIGKLDFILGYMIAFGLLAAIQAVLASVVLLYGLDVMIDGPEWFLIIVAVLGAVLGAALGLFVSAFAKTEFQAVQFMPAFVMPQVLVSGLFMPLGSMPELLEAIARALPLTYVIEALNEVTNNPDITTKAWWDFGIIVACIVAAVLLGALTLRRQVK
jgi:ABC-2 type transport system permease protein